jgi:CRISPR system Cascade subunit CasB
MSLDIPDFSQLYQRFNDLPTGARAELRRAAAPDDLRDMPGLYRLFPNSRPSDRQVRLAFLLPWCKEVQTGKTFGALCADAKIAEARIIQIARASPPDDLIGLRRLAMQLHPAVGWLDLASLLWFWGTKKKRQLVEDYYIAFHKLDQGAKA